MKLFIVLVTIHPIFLLGVLFRKDLAIGGVGVGVAAAVAASAQESFTQRKRLSRRRRKTQRELIHVQTDGNRRQTARVYDNNTEGSVALDIDAPTAKKDQQRPIDQTALNIQEKGASVISIRSENREIIGPDKGFESSSSSSSVNNIRNDENKQDKKEYPVVEKLNAKVRANQMTAITEADDLMKMLRVAENSMEMKMSMSMSMEDEDEDEDDVEAMIKEAMIYYSFSMNVEAKARTRNFKFPDKDVLLQAYSNVMPPGLSLDEGKTRDVKAVFESFESIFEERQPRLRMMSMSMPPAAAPSTLMHTSGYVPVTTPTENEGPPKRPSTANSPIPFPTISMTSTDGEENNTSPSQPDPPVQSVTATALTGAYQQNPSPASASNNAGDLGFDPDSPGNSMSSIEGVTDDSSEKKDGGEGADTTRVGEPNGLTTTDDSDQETSKSDAAGGASSNEDDSSSTRSTDTFRLLTTVMMLGLTFSVA